MKLDLTMFKYLPHICKTPIHLERVRKHSTSYLISQRSERKNPQSPREGTETQLH